MCLWRSVGFYHSHATRQVSTFGLIVALGTECMPHVELKPGFSSYNDMIE